MKLNETLITSDSFLKPSQKKIVRKRSEACSPSNERSNSKEFKQFRYLRMEKSRQNLQLK